MVASDCGVLLKYLFFHLALDVHVDRECLVKSEGEEECAVCDFLTHACDECENILDICVGKMLNAVVFFQKVEESFSIVVAIRGMFEFWKIMNETRHCQGSWRSRRSP